MIFIQPAKLPVVYHMMHFFWFQFLFVFSLLLFLKEILYV